MIIEELKSLINISSVQNKSNLYIRSLLKEFLQVYVLNYIYLNPNYNKNFLFTGGTCLRHCFGLNRLSEDLDFDLKNEIDANNLKSSIEAYFKTEFMYDGLQVSILQKGRQLLLKFPVLKELKLATESESDLLYIKLDMSLMASKIYNQNSTLKSINNFNYLVTHYDLPTLFASKIVTILTRQRFLGKENINVVKGRDYFDLLWFLDKKVIPNLDRINDLIKSSYTITDMVDLVDEKVKIATTISQQYFKQDLLPFIDNHLILDGYIENFAKNYNQNKSYLCYTTSTA
ncbi:hypothetical protein COU93_02860 [Candidatus Shapirobacteria bacterium CG10_big_fil_rev_8_21_14_0_10_36_6]|uniref:Nucleotidyl transferase AbiEii/AbiGii toxin family protein n=1 Tax=Candidatus Shapirobacteria bacterium CG10_big_fil_rev_8_21_14_0_10_36_6 TaxID=1974886 RepID=A0A2M8L193_9BACT|nr:MAG: hypothetical protein COU93_02860 [Candidatus Shapirobacteria bacterium CG10_big_fil_rev_8_21_14_0_10_36_6]